MQSLRNTQKNMDHTSNMIHHFFRPDEVQRELDDWKQVVVPNNRSVDDHLDRTDSLIQWAQKKAPETNPANRRPVTRLNDSPDYNIEFTRLNKTDQGVLSLSSWNIPATSSTSMSAISVNSTPRENTLNRRSSNVPKRGACTPSEFIRKKQSVNIDMAAIQNQNRKNSFGFEPLLFSTPIQSKRKKPSIFQTLNASAKPQNEITDSGSNAGRHDKDDALMNNKSTSTPINKTNRTLTQANQSEDSQSTLVPATQTSNESLIPETQDDHVPETQEERLPETEESYTHDYVATEPVQAKVSQINKQAVPRDIVSNFNSSRILSRPPIRGASTPPIPIATKSVLKTPSRIPVPKSPPRVSKLNNRTVTTVNVPNVMDESERPTISQASSRQQTGKTIVVITSPSRQTVQPTTVPTPVVPTSSNMTINVNVNKSNSQPSKEIVDGASPKVNSSRKSKQIEGDAKSKRSTTSNDSIMTNDSSDSDGNRADTSRLMETPLATHKMHSHGENDRRNNSAKRQLFSGSSKDQRERRRSATYDKIDSLQGCGSILLSTQNCSQAQKVSTQRNTKSLHGISSTQSQTYVKSNKSLPNATYDISHESDHAHNPNQSMNSDEILSIDLTESGSSNMAELPSEARLESISNIANGDDTNREQNDFGNSSSDCSAKANDKANQKHANAHSNHTATSVKNPTSKELNPVVVLSPLNVETMQKSSRKPSAVPLDLILSPPTNFQNSRRTGQFENDDLIVEASPSTCEMRKRLLEQCSFDQFTSPFFRKPDAEQSEAAPKSKGHEKQRKRGRQKLVRSSELEKLQNISFDLNNKSSSSIRQPRRLTNPADLHNDYYTDIDIAQDTVTPAAQDTVTPAASTSNPVKSTAIDNVFKVPDIPSKKSSRKSKANSLTKTKNRTIDSDVNTTTNSSTSASLPIAYNEFSLNITLMSDAELQAYMPQNGNSSIALNRLEQSTVSSKRNSHARKSQPHSTETKKSNSATETATSEPENAVELDTANDENEIIDTNTNQRNTRSHAAAPATAAYTTTKSKTIASKSGKNNTKNKAVNSKTTSKPKSNNKTDRAQNTDATDNAASIGPIRRTSRERQPGDSFRKSLLNDYYVLSLNSVKRKPEKTQTAPVARSRLEHEPPKKKFRTDPEIRPSNKLRTFTESNMSSKSKQGQPSTSSASVTGAHYLGDFIIGLNQKRMMREAFWQDLTNYGKNNDIQHEDVTYIKTSEGIIEVANHKQFDYVEMDGVKYGFVPSANKRFGWMRFSPGAKKAHEISSGVIHLHILQGAFEIRGVDGEILLEAAYEIMIGKNVSYEITNIGKKTGIIQFEYAE